MANDDFLEKEQGVIDYYKAESVRNFERHITNEFNSNVEILENQIAQLKKSLAITEANIFLN